MQTVEETGDKLSIKAVCAVLGVSRATYYRRRKRKDQPPPPPAPRTSPRRLSTDEEEQVVEVLNSDRFADHAVPEVHATLLDEGEYVCSVRTMYRVLKRREEVRERRDQRVHPAYTKPELLATRPNELWSWDITRIKGPKSWIFYHLYVVLDVFSRYVVGWMVSETESGEEAEALVGHCCEQQAIGHDEVTLHSDRGKAMRSKRFIDLLIELGVARSYSRPHVSNDNPYSEAQFKTLKYHWTFPERFGSPEDARQYLREFFGWYNDEHRHSGLAMMTPADVHAGRADERWQQRKQTLLAAYERHPERFVRGEPSPRQVPEEVWINKPKELEAAG
jgi:putative transposase